MIHTAIKFNIPSTSIQYWFNPRFVLAGFNWFDSELTLILCLQSYTVVFYGVKCQASYRSNLEKSRIHAEYLEVRAASDEYSLAQIPH